MEGFCTITVRNPSAEGFDDPSAGKYSAVFHRAEGLNR